MPQSLICPIQFLNYQFLNAIPQLPIPQLLNVLLSFPPLAQGAPAMEAGEEGDGGK